MTKQTTTRQFVIRAAGFLTVQAVLLAMFAFLYRVDPDGYLGMSERKQARLRIAARPRIVLVGGSAVAFGFNSPMLERAFGRPVINMGLQGSLGLSVKLAEVADWLGEDDWVVLSLEYEHYAGTIREGLTVWGWLERDWGRWRYLAFGDIEAALDTGHLYLRNVTTTVLRSLARGQVSTVQRPYDPASFDEQGDVVGHRGMKGEGFAGQAFAPARFRDSGLASALDQLIDFAAHARLRGARVFVYFPPVPRSAIQPVVPALDRIERMVRDVPSLHVLNQPRELFWDDDRFFDTLYHLSWEGQLENTRFLVERLEVMSPR